MVPAVPAQASPHRSSRPPSPRRPSRPSRLASPPGRPSALRHRLSCPGAPPRPCQRGGTWPSLAPLPGQARAARTGLSRRRPWPSGNRCLPSPLTHPRRGTVQAESPAPTLARPGTSTTRHCSGEHFNGSTRGARRVVQLRLQCCFCDEHWPDLMIASYFTFCTRQVEKV